MLALVFIFAISAMDGPLAGGVLVFCTPADAVLHSEPNASLSFAGAAAVGLAAAPAERDDVLLLMLAIGVEEAGSFVDMEV